MTDRKDLPEFIWQAEDSDHTLLNGVISARTELIARVELKQLGYQFIKIKTKPRVIFIAPPQSITATEITLFARQLATLISAGIPLVQSVDIIAKGNENLSMQTLLIKIKATVEKGDSLTEALAQHPKHFDTLFCNLVAAGEQSGLLEALLDNIATYREKTERLKKKIKKALTYPLAVLIVAMIVMAILLLFVVPVFEDMFKSFGAELPFFTQVVITLSEGLAKYSGVIVLILLFMAGSFFYFKKHSGSFNHALDHCLLKLPLIGLIINQSTIARFARTLALLSTAGIPLIDALQSVSGTCGNLIYSAAIMKMREEVATGQRLNHAMHSTALFPNRVEQMIAVGEESGALEAMLIQIADFYEAEVNNLVDNLTSLMEPFIMVVLGVLIGGLIIAMYLPIFTMGAVIG